MRVVRQGLVLALASLALLCTPASSFAVHAGKMVRAQAGHVRPPGRVVMAAPMQQALLAGAFFDTPFTAWLLPLGGLLPSSPARRTIVSIATLAVLAVFKLGSSMLPTRNGAKPDAPTALPDAEAKAGKLLPLRIAIAIAMAAPMQQALLAGAFFDTPFTAWLLPLGGLLPSSPARRTIVSIATLAVLAVFKLGSSILPTRNGAKPDAPTALPDAEAKVGKVVPLRISPLKQKTSAAPVEELTLEPFVALGAAFAGVAADSAAAVASATFTLISGDEEASST